MKHFGIFITDLESERFLTASNDQIATWLFLHAYCSKQTNGGTIQDAATLPERFWSRHGITADILTKPSPLWSWSDSDLSVEPYDIGGEELYLKKSKGGKAGNQKRWKGTDNRTPNRTPNPPNQTRPNQTRPDQTSPNQNSSSDEEIDSFDLEESPSPKKANPLQELAERIYQEYPRKEGKPKGIKAILAAMKKERPALLLERTKEYATAICWREKQFIPLPATWFNDERFNDDPENWKQPANGSKPTAASTANVNTGRRTAPTTTI